MIKVFERWIDRYFAEEEAVLVAVLLIGAIAIVLTLGVVLAPMFTALILAFLLQGMVIRLKSWGVPHIWAVATAFVVLVACIVIGLLVLLPAMWKQVLNLVAEAPRMIKQIQHLLLILPERYPQLVTEEQVRQLTAAVGTEISTIGPKILSFSFAQLPVLMGILIYLVLVPILVFFFLKDADVMLRWFASILPRKRPVMKQIWWEMNQQIANYVRGKVVEIVIVSGITSVVFSVLGVNYALLLGIITGISVLIPYIGAAFATIPVFLIGFFQWGWTGDLLYLMLAYTIIQALDGNILVPLLFSEAVKMHPVAIVLSVLVFGGIWGFWGVFFAIPLATLCKAVINAWPTSDVSNQSPPDQAIFLDN